MRRKLKKVAEHWCSTDFIICFQLYPCIQLLQLTRQKKSSLRFFFLLFYLLVAAEDLDSAERRFMIDM